MFSVGSIASLAICFVPQPNCQMIMVMLNLLTMKNLMFLICALALFVAGFTSVTHADMPNMECSHHAFETASSDQDCADDQTKDQSDLGECQDCCCIHSHVFAGTYSSTSTNFALKSRMVFEPHASLRSNDSSSLYRPPIV
jgi:hypothetical protein